MASTAGLAPGFKDRVDKLLAASRGKVTVRSGFRTRAQQEQARRDNGCPDVYKSSPKTCRVETAIPGTSKHETGQAVDFGGDLALVARLAPAFGLRRTVASENWHYESTDASSDGAAPSSGGGGIVETVAGFGGDLVEGTVGTLINGLKRLTITGLFLATGIGLVVAGAYRGSTGRQLSADVAGVAGDAVSAVATKGAKTPRSAP